ncbi:MAG: hypothetical protein AVDCRST_MAG78-2054 [uncultured Rubrobacteraceae bacterium]|uniref:Uncharacterized protein n=1 Tax=uncultured Rubrobacteraceae bacterium TaxID=349277 RepID=A0A6J4Q850_9ACTN|nr:MAG: hypothetical protein AVDCRST_MAG78-2054 [uncultured Rubrobacteraceae bacterium]
MVPGSAERMFFGGALWQFFAWVAGAWRTVWITAMEIGASLTSRR